MKGKYFIVFIIIAAIFIFREIDFNNPGFSHNQNEYTLLLVVLVLSAVYLFRRNR
jgi:hypothetical protein